MNPCNTCLTNFTYSGGVNICDTCEARKDYEKERLGREERSARYDYEKKVGFRKTECCANCKFHSPFAVDVVICEKMNDLVLDPYVETCCKCNLWEARE